MYVCVVYKALLDNTVTVYVCMCVCVHMYVPMYVWSDSSPALGTYSGLFAISSCATFEGDLPRCRDDSLLCRVPHMWPSLHRAGHTVGCGKGPHECSYMMYG